MLSICSHFRSLKKLHEIVLIHSELTWNLFCCMAWFAVEFTSESKFQFFFFSVIRLSYIV